MGKVTRVLSVAEVLGAHPGGGHCCAWAIPGRAKTTKQLRVAAGQWALLGAPGGALAVVRGRAGAGARFSRACLWLLSYMLLGERIMQIEGVLLKIPSVSCAYFT